jgi:hypothetical protein
MVAPDISGHGVRSRIAPPQSISFAFLPRPIEDDHRRSGLPDERRIIGASLTERSMASVLNAMSFANMQPTSYGSATCALISPIIKVRAVDYIATVKVALKISPSACGRSSNAGDCAAPWLARPQRALVPRAALLFAVFQGQTCLLHAHDHAHRSTLIVFVSGLDRHPGDSCVLWGASLGGNVSAQDVFRHKCIKAYFCASPRHTTVAIRPLRSKSRLARLRRLGLRALPHQA